MRRIGADVRALSAIFVTHEHQDHIGGVFKLARRYGIPVWMSVGTYQAATGDSTDVPVNFCRDSESVTVGSLVLTPFTVPHDAREPLQFHVSDGRYKLGVLTDAGQMTAHMVAALNGCDALVLEFNHDGAMLADSSYPPSLKRRISSPFGHLSNQEASHLLRELDQSRLKKLVGAHLSESNNTPELAWQALQAGLTVAGVDVRVACQQEGFDWIDVGS